MAKAAGFNGETHIKSQNDQLKFAAGWKQRSQRRGVSLPIRTDNVLSEQI